MRSAQRVIDTEILTEEMLAFLKREVPRILGHHLFEPSNGRESFFEDNLRFNAVGANCRVSREKMCMTIKEASMALKVPQYRLKEIEMGAPRNIVPEVLHHYIDFLGLSRWYRKWQKANVNLAARLRPNGDSRKRVKNPSSCDKSGSALSV